MGANITDAIMKDVSLEEAILDGANLQGANLTNASFYGSSLENVIFIGAILVNIIVSQNIFSRKLLNNEVVIPTAAMTSFPEFTLMNIESGCIDNK